MVSMSKKPYPQNDDLVNAILKVLSKAYTMTPDEFPEAVKKQLEEEGFYTGLVTTKRIWQLYEKLVRNGQAVDVFGVVQDLGQRE
ncbi:hypothetical protein TCARB_1886 [Thermofilum adornatum 1505]|nr:hypothetical protein TCARB_1886 [Thermofilum adornatum 1505]